MDAYRVRWIGRDWLSVAEKLTIVEIESGGLPLVGCDVAGAGNIVRGTLSKMGIEAAEAHVKVRIELGNVHVVMRRTTRNGTGSC